MMIPCFAESHPGMIRRSLRRAIVGLILITCTVVLISPSSASAQVENVQENQSPWYVGYNGFRMLLEERGLSVTLDLGRAFRNPRESVMVLLGNVDSIPQTDWLRLRTFVSAGGSLLIASEHAAAIPGVCAILPGPVSSADPAVRYEQFTDCLQLAPVNSEHPLTQGITRLVLNRTGWLSRLPVERSLDWQVIIRLPVTCSPHAAREQPVMIAGLAADSAGGVMIVAADQSLYSDGMIWHGENSLLAVRTSDLLCRGRRRWLAVVQEGVPVPGYLATLPQTAPQVTPPPLPQNPPPLPEPDLATMLRIANTAIDKVQESNVLNEALRDRPRNVNPVAWLRTILLVLLIVGTLWILWRLARITSQLGPLPTNRFMQSMYGVLSAKQVESSEFGSAVEILAKDLCRELTGSGAEADWQKLAVSGMPDLPLSRASRKSLTELAGIATKGCRIHISGKMFRAFGQSIQEIRRVHRQSLLTTQTHTAGAGS